MLITNFRLNGASSSMIYESLGKELCYDVSTQKESQKRQRNEPKRTKNVCPTDSWPCNNCKCGMLRGVGRFSQSRRGAGWLGQFQVRCVTVRAV